MAFQDLTLFSLLHGEPALAVRELRRRKIRVAKVILYGSRVSGKAHEYSDKVA